MSSLAMPVGFESLEDAARATSSAVLRIYAAAAPRGERLALAEVYRFLRAEQREESAEASVLAKSWMKGDLLPLMWEAAETYANALLKAYPLKDDGIFLDLQWELSKIPRKYRAQAKAIWQPESLDAHLEAEAAKEIESDEDD